jgi:hypothetical protein
MAQWIGTVAGNGVGTVVRQFVIDNAIELEESVKVMAKAASCTFILCSFGSLLREP